MGMNAGAAAPGGGVSGLEGAAPLTGGAPGAFAGELSSVLQTRSGDAEAGLQAEPLPGEALEAAAEMGGEGLFAQAAAAAEPPRPISGEWQLRAAGSEQLNVQAPAASGFPVTAGSAGEASPGAAAPDGFLAAPGKGFADSGLPDVSARAGASGGLKNFEGTPPTVSPLLSALRTADAGERGSQVAGLASGNGDQGAEGAGARAPRRWQSELPEELRAGGPAQLQSTVSPITGTAGEAEAPEAAVWAGADALRGSRHPAEPAGLPAEQGQGLPGSAAAGQAATLRSGPSGQSQGGSAGPEVPMSASMPGMGTADGGQVDAMSALASSLSPKDQLADLEDGDLAGRTFSRFDSVPTRTGNRPAAVNMAGAASASAIASAMSASTGAGQTMWAQVLTGTAHENAAGPGANVDLDEAALEWLEAADAGLEGDGDFAATVRGGALQGAARTDSLQMPTQTQSAHAAGQVAVEMARNLKNGQSNFQMRFDPPELGRVDVKMRVGADGTVQAHLAVERPETLDMFLRDQRALERALENAGLNTGSGDLQFSLKQDNDQQMASGDGHSGHGAGGDQAAGSDKDGLIDGDSDLGDGLIHRMTLAQQRGGLDIKI